MLCKLCEKSETLGNATYCPECIGLIKKGAEKGEVLLQLYLGNCYKNGNGVPQDNELAFSWYKKSADQGNPAAQYALCLCYFNGEGVQENKQIGLEWCEKSAAQGNVQAQTYLGVCYFYGVGVCRDAKKAFELFQKSNRDEFSQFMLGQCYFYGEGVTKSKKQAILWFKKSAEQGNTRACFFLSDCYFFGDGIEKDEQQSEYWHAKAFKSRHNKSKENSLFENIQPTTWQECFMQYVFKSGKKNPEIYKKADMSRQEFHRINSNKNHAPTKPTVLALAIGLELEMSETIQFLADAGCAFSRFDKRDDIIKDFISKKIFNIEKINEEIEEYNLLHKKERGFEKLQLLGDAKNSEKSNKKNIKTKSKRRQKP